MSESIKTATKSLRYWAHRGLQAAAQKTSGQLTTRPDSDVGQVLQRWGYAELRGGKLFITESGTSAIPGLDVGVPDDWFDYTAHAFYDNGLKQVCIAVVMDTRSEIGVDVPAEERTCVVIPLADVFDMADFPRGARRHLIAAGFLPDLSATQNPNLLGGWRPEPFGYSMTVHPVMEPPTLPVKRP